MAKSRVTPFGWLQETDAKSRVTPFGWVQESQAAGGVTLSPSVGTLVFVGQTPTIEVTAGEDLTAAPSVGTLLFIGQQPSVSFSHSVDPTTGELVFVGQTPDVSFTAGEAVYPEAGTLRFTGQDPTVGFTHSVAPESGTVRFDGQTPTVQTEGDKTVDPLSGLLRFLGQIPGVLGGEAVNVDQPSGGWLAYNAIQSERARRRRKELQDEIEAEEAREALAGQLERTLIEDGVLTPSEADSIRLDALVAQYAKGDLPNRAQRAVDYAARAKTEMAYQLALREMQRISEQEEMAVLMALALD